MTSDYFIGIRFRAANDYVARPGSGFVAAWPNFHEARYPNPDRRVYGHFLLRDSVVDWRDVPAAEYGNVRDARSRFTGAHDYARRQGYQQGFPNWHEATYGGRHVYGTFLVVPGTCVWRDIPARELGLGDAEPTAFSMNYWFTGASNYAATHGFAAAMPNGHCAKINGRWVCGVFLFPPGSAEWRDIRGRELGLPDIYPPVIKPPPQKVKLPSLSGLSYDDVVSALKVLGLKFFPVYPVGFDFRDKDSLVVAGQGPVAGTEMVVGSQVTVIFAMKTAPAVGISTVTLTNRHANQRRVTLHVWKESTGRWTELGVLDVGQSRTLNMDDGVLALVVGVDTGLINCSGTNPADLNCRRWQQFFAGDSNGPPVSADIF